MGDCRAFVSLLDAATGFKAMTSTGSHVYSFTPVRMSTDVANARLSTRGGEVVHSLVYNEAVLVYSIGSKRWATGNSSTLMNSASVSRLSFKSEDLLSQTGVMVLVLRDEKGRKMR